MTQGKRREKRQQPLTESVHLGLSPDGEWAASPVLTLRNVSSGVDIDIPGSWTMDEACNQIEKHRDHLAYHQSMLTGAVIGARVAGVSWAVIGQILGMTRQAAWKAYSEWEPEDLG